RESGIRMAQAVWTTCCPRWQAADGSLEPTRNAVRAFRAAIRSAEHEVEVRSVLQSPGPSFELLSCAVLSQHSHGVLIYTDRPTAVSCLRRREVPLAIVIVVETELLLDAERVRVPLHVQPAEAERLAATHS